MTAEVRVWTCPICIDDIDVTLNWRTQGVSLVRTLVIDDMDARLHMAWHQMCTCEWDHVHTDEQVDPVQVLRQQGVDCPMHP